VRPAPEGLAGQGLDFEYVIHNADGGEVEHCGNGARCFVRYVREKGLTAKDAVKVKVVGGVLELRQNPDGRVTVDMGAPVFDLKRIPFEPTGLEARSQGSWQVWPLDIEEKQDHPSANRSESAPVLVAVLSMGNPHAVQVVDDVDTAPLQTQGAAHRAPSGLSAAGERRLHAGRQPIAHSPARLRARRRRDAGLWHRRLRRGGGGHPARAARPPCRRRDPGRPTDHRVGQRQRRPGGAGADDRPGHDCFRRRDRHS
jgi:diaminopimelate epimerase